MKRLALAVSLVLVCAMGCKKDKVPDLVSNNDDNNTNGTNGNPNSGTNGTPNSANNLGTIVVADPDRDYSGTAPAFGGGGAVAQFIHDLNTTECEALFACLDNVNSVFLISSLRASDVGECVSALNARRSPAIAQASADAARTTLDATAADECLTFIQNSTCSVIAPISLEPFALVDACQSALVGTAIDSEPCDQSWDCAAGSYCSQIFDGCFGSCETVENFKNICGDAVCDLDEICGQDNTCRDLSGANVDCAFDSQCADGLLCNQGKCEAMVLVAEDSGCGAEYVCRPGLLCDAGTCVNLTAKDAPCDSPFTCAWDLGCTGGTCAAGITCDGEGDCPSRRCVGTVCLPVDESCYDQ